MWDCIISHLDSQLINTVASVVTATTLTVSTIIGAIIKYRLWIKRMGRRLRGYILLEEATETLNKEIKRNNLVLQFKELVRILLPSYQETEAIKLYCARLILHQAESYELYGTNLNNDKFEQVDFKEFSKVILDIVIEGTNRYGLYIDGDLRYTNLSIKNKSLKKINEEICKLIKVS